MRLTLTFVAILTPSFALGTVCVPMPPEMQQESQVQPPAVTNKDVLDMLRAGLSSAVVVAKIKNSVCSFDTSPASLKELKGAGVPDEVILAMVESVKASTEPTDTKLALTGMLSPEVLAERAKRDTDCPGCKGIILFYVDPESSKTQRWWRTNNQEKWLQDEHKRGIKEKIKPGFWFTMYEANADYIIFWSQAQGYRPYTYVVPHTQTETAQVSGSYNSYGSRGSDWGTYSGTVRVNKTYYQNATGQWPYVDVVMSIYDSRTGEKIHETWHQGNWRWSKPEKDCLVDTFKFLRKRHPEERQSQ